MIKKKGAFHQLKQIRQRRIDFIWDHHKKMSRREMARHLECMPQVIYRLMHQMFGDKYEKRDL